MLNYNNTVLNNQDYKDINSIGCFTGESAL